VMRARFLVNAFHVASDRVTRHAGNPALAHCGSYQLTSESVHKMGGGCVNRRDSDLTSREPQLRGVDRGWGAQG
jgi:hypothetical protein